MTHEHNWIEKTIFIYFKSLTIKMYQNFENRQI